METPIWSSVGILDPEWQQSVSKSNDCELRENERQPVIVVVPYSLLELGLVLPSPLL